jgi:hypothetical protein
MLGVERNRSAGRADLQSETEVNEKYDRQPFALALISRTQNVKGLAILGSVEAMTPMLIHLRLPKTRSVLVCTSCQPSMPNRPSSSRTIREFRRLTPHHGNLPENDQCASLGADRQGDSRM